MSEKTVHESSSSGGLRSPYSEDNLPNSPYLVPGNTASGKDISIFPIDDFFHAEHVGHTFTSLVSNGQSIKEPVEQRPNQYNRLGCLSYSEAVDSGVLERESLQQLTMPGDGSKRSNAAAPRTFRNGSLVHTSVSSARENQWEGTQESHLQGTIAPCLTHVDPQTNHIYTSQGVFLSSAADWKVTESCMETFTKACSQERQRTHFTIKNLKVILHGLQDLSLDNVDREPRRGSVAAGAAAAPEKESTKNLSDAEDSNKDLQPAESSPRGAAPQSAQPDLSLGGVVYKFHCKSDDFVSAVLSEPYQPPAGRAYDKTMLPVGRAAGLPGSVQALQSYTSMLSSGQSDYVQFRVNLASKQLSKELLGVDSLLKTLHIQLPTDSKAALRQRMSEVCGTSISHEDFISYLRFLNSSVKQLSQDHLEVEQHIGSDFVPVLQAYLLHQLQESTPGKVEQLIQHRLQRMQKGVEQEQVLIDWRTGENEHPEDAVRVVQNGTPQSIFRHAMLDWLDMRRLFEENKASIEQWEAQLPAPVQTNQQEPNRLINQAFPKRATFVSSAATPSMTTEAVLSVYGAKTPVEKEKPQQVKNTADSKPRKLEDITRKTNTTKSTSQSGETRILEAKRAGLVKKYKAVTSRILALPFTALPGTLPLQLQEDGSVAVLEGALPVDLSQTWAKEMTNPANMPAVFTVGDVAGCVYGGQSQQLIPLRVQDMDTTVKQSKRVRAKIPAYLLDNYNVAPSESQQYTEYLASLQAEQSPQKEQLQDRSKAGMQIGDIAWTPSPGSEQALLQRVQKAAEGIPDAVFQGRVLDTVPQKHYRLPYGGVVKPVESFTPKVAMPILGATAQQLERNVEAPTTKLDYNNTRTIRNVVAANFTPAFPFEAPLITPNSILMQIHEVDEELRAISKAAAGLPNTKVVPKQLAIPSTARILPIHTNTNGSKTLPVLPAAKLRKAGLAVLE